MFITANFSNKKQPYLAIEILRQLLLVDSSNKNVTKRIHFKIATLYHGIDFKLHHDDVIENTEKILKIDRNFFDARMLKARAHFRMNQNEKAMAEVKIVLKMSLSKEWRQTAIKLQEEIHKSMQESPRGANHEKNKENRDEDKENRETNKENRQQNRENFSKSFNSKYSSTNNKEKVDNRKFFEKFGESEFKPSCDDRRKSTPYSTENTSNKYFKETFKTEAKKNFKQTQDEILADKKNVSGCAEYKAKRYEKALKLYSEAIALCPKNVKYFVNRSACYIAMENFKLALADALKAIEVDPSYWKGYSRAVNCLLSLGDIQLIGRYLEKFNNNVVGVDSMNFNEIPKYHSLKDLNKKIENFYSEKNFGECLKNLEAARKIATACDKYVTMTIECMIMVEKHAEADEMIHKALIKNPREASMIFLQGLKCYYKGSLELSVMKFKSSLTVDKDFIRAQQYRNKASQLIELMVAGEKN
jgi:tetratricopeptide (TPR) repeat protein